MKIEHYIKRVEEHEEFKKLKKQHPKSWFCAGFFVLDFENGKHTYQIDYFLPGIKKIATFNLNEGVEMHLSEKFNGNQPEEISGEVKVDVDALKGIIVDEMKNRMVTEEIKKIIAVLQNREGKRMWVINCITSGLGIIKVKIDDDTCSIIDFEKASLFDFIKKAK